MERARGLEFDASSSLQGTRFCRHTASLRMKLGNVYPHSSVLVYEIGGRATRQWRRIVERRPCAQMLSFATRSRNYNVPLEGMNGRELEEANTSGLAS